MKPSKTNPKSSPPAVPFCNTMITDGVKNANQESERRSQRHRRIDCGGGRPARSTSASYNYPKHAITRKSRRHHGRIPRNRQSHRTRVHVRQGATVAFHLSFVRRKGATPSKQNLARTGGNVRGFKSDAAQMDQAESPRQRLS